jgi:hypothetical protein
MASSEACLAPSTQPTPPISTTGNAAHGIYFIGSTDDNTFTLTDSTVTATGDGAYALYASEFELIETEANYAIVNLNHSVLNGGIGVGVNSTLTLSADGQSTITGRLSVVEDSALNLTLGDGSTLVATGYLTNLTLQNGSILGYTGETLHITDTITIGNTITVNLSALTEAGYYILLDWDTGTVSASAFTATDIAPDLQGSFTIADKQLIYTASAIPEPATRLLLGAGLGMLLLAVRHRRRNACF